MKAELTCPSPCHYRNSSSGSDAMSLLAAAALESDKADKGLCDLEECNQTDVEDGHQAGKPPSGFLQRHCADALTVTALSDVSLSCCSQGICMTFIHSLPTYSSPRVRYVQSYGLHDIACLQSAVA